MAKLVDLKRTAKERKKNSEPMKISGDDYPYGLTVHLDHEALEKLGIKNLPKAGGKVMLHAHAHVKSTEDRTEDGGKRRRSMSLELRKMALEATQRAADDPNIHEGKLRGAKAAMDKALDRQEGKPGEAEDEGDDE